MRFRCDIQEKQKGGSSCMFIPVIIIIIRTTKSASDSAPFFFHQEASDLSEEDDDDDAEQKKCFRVDIDGTMARFKLTKEDWTKISVKSFPSGGRLLSGPWTRIFADKIKESNPWCNVRFRNNHVKSAKSRQVHSSVFFRGGAECKRPECSVKMKLVIREQYGEQVEVTYNGNVCHSDQP